MATQHTMRNQPFLEKTREWVSAKFEHDQFLIIEGLAYGGAFVNVWLLTVAVYGGRAHVSGFATPCSSLKQIIYDL